MNNTIFKNSATLYAHLASLTPEEQKNFRRTIIDHHIMVTSTIAPALYCELLQEFDSLFDIYNYLNIPYMIETCPESWHFYVEHYPHQAFLSIYLDLHGYSSRFERACYQEAIAVFEQQAEHSHYAKVFSFILSGLRHQNNEDALIRIARRYGTYDTPLEQLMSIAFLAPQYAYDDNNIQAIHDLCHKYTGGGTLEELFVFLQIAPYVNVEAYQPIFEHFPEVHSNLLIHNRYNNDYETHEFFQHFSEWEHQYPSYQEDTLLLSF